jgi:hypothetical protein
MPYNTIPDAEIDPDSPVTASLMQKMRDNPIGIAQAAAGAPKVQYNALNGSGITHAYSTGATINFAAFAHTPTGNVTHIIFVNIIDTANNDGGVTVSLNGSVLFTASTNVNGLQRNSEMRVSLTSNASHSFTFSSSGTLSATVISIAS